MKDDVVAPVPRPIRKEGGKQDDDESYEVGRGRKSLRGECRVVHLMDNSRKKWREARECDIAAEEH